MDFLIYDPSFGEIHRIVTSNGDYCDIKKN